MDPLWLYYPQLNISASEIWIADHLEVRMFSVDPIKYCYKCIPTSLSICIYYLNMHWAPCKQKDILTHTKALFGKFFSSQLNSILFTQLPILLHLAVWIKCWCKLCSSWLQTLASFQTFLPLGLPQVTIALSCICCSFPPYFPLWASGSYKWNWDSMFHTIIWLQGIFTSSLKCRHKYVTTNEQKQGIGDTWYACPRCSSATCSFALLSAPVTKGFKRNLDWKPKMEKILPMN